jgi:hypothetical protein
VTNQRSLGIVVDMQTHHPEVRMPERLIAAALVSAIGAVAATAEGIDDNGWIIDHATARVIRADAIERGADGGILGDRIVFDLRGKDGIAGTLTINCTTRRYAIVLSGREPLTQEGALSDAPLATSAAAYCEKIDALPAANPLTPITPRRN